MGSYVMDEMVGSTARVLLPYGHAEVLKTHSRTELVAGADPDQARLGDFGRRWEVDRLYSDHREMLERETPEVVSIANPPTLHAQHVVDCAERGVKGIFCEKPIAPTLAQADEMIRACEAKGAALAINHVRRGDPYMQQAHKLLEGGEIGDLLTVTVTWAGRLFLTGTHSYDLVNYFLGDIPTRWLMGHAEEPSSEMSRRPHAAWQRRRWHRLCCLRERCPSILQRPRPPHFVASRDFGNQRPDQPDAERRAALEAE